MFLSSTVVDSSEGSSNGFKTDAVRVSNSNNDSHSCSRTSSILLEARSSQKLNSKAVAKNNLNNTHSDLCNLCNPSSHSQTSTALFYPHAVLPPFSIPCARPVERVYSTRALRRGVCLVFSIEKFYSALCLPARNGAAVDLRNVCTAFSTLEFEVLTYTNLTASEMLSAIQKVANIDHSDSDCFACVVLTHGDENGIIYAYDRPVSLDQIILPFRGDRCASLRGKPKLFFYPGEYYYFVLAEQHSLHQACRGSKLDDGTVQLVCDGPGTANVIAPVPTVTLCNIPVEADILVAHAVQPGYYAFRNSLHGSWFIRALCDSLIRYGHSLDLLSILTRVNHVVAYDFESVASNPAFSGKKQMPCFASALTKEVIFPPKRLFCKAKPN
ncbi:hypothetical protein EG68_03291 [Paragonimus skrjabini miyazakii]|uniref:Caspase-7 n=1 Tax=Paragonimus skrjabini miyazakii TaxID=59628 RepID=A0A8S9Z4M1_9TREM|nr:hypothetical protein EG68_03291 [Paragonimus skrjabini miyazakii]